MTSRQGLGLQIMNSTKRRVSNNTKVKPTKDNDKMDVVVKAKTIASSSSSSSSPSSSSCAGRNRPQHHHHHQKNPNNTTAASVGRGGGGVGLSGMISSGLITVTKKQDSKTKKFRKTLLLNQSMKNDQDWEDLLQSREAIVSSMHCVEISERFFGLGIAGGQNNDRNKSNVQKLFEHLLLRREEHDDEHESLSSKKGQSRTTTQTAAGQLREVIVRGTLNSGLGVSSIFPSSSANDSPKSKSTIDCNRWKMNSSLCILRIQSGFTFQHTNDISILGNALRDQRCLKELTIRNFSMNCQDINPGRRQRGRLPRISGLRPPSESPATTTPSRTEADADHQLLDPILEAIATIPTIEVIDITCMMAHYPRIPTMATTSSTTKAKDAGTTSFVSTKSLKDCLQSNLSLSKLSLSKLGLADQHLQLLYNHTLKVSRRRKDVSSAPNHLTELILDDNIFTEDGFIQYLFPCIAKTPSVRTLKAYSPHVRLSSSGCDALLKVLNKTGVRLDTLKLNLPWEYRPSVEYALALTKVGIKVPGFGSESIGTTAARIPDQRVVANLDATKDNYSASYTVLRQSPQICRHVHVKDHSRRQQNVPIPAGFMPSATTTTTGRNGAVAGYSHRRRGSTGVIGRGPAEVAPKNSGITAPRTPPQIIMARRRLDIDSPAAKFLQAPWTPQNIKSTATSSGLEDDDDSANQQKSPCSPPEELFYSSCATSNSTDIGSSPIVGSITPPALSTHDDEEDGKHEDADSSALGGDPAIGLKPPSSLERTNRKHKKQRRPQSLKTVRRKTNEEEPQRRHSEPSRRKDRRSATSYYYEDSDTSSAASREGNNRVSQQQRHRRRSSSWKKGCIDTHKHKRILV